MKPFLLQSILLIFSFLAVLLWQKSSVQEYTAPLLGLLTVMYLFTTMWKKRKNKQNNASGSKNAIISILLLNTCALLLIFSTGGFQSILFFLLYFLSFSIGFLLMPETVFVYAILVLLIFLPDSLQGNILINVTKLASLLLICPLAYFFGKAVNVREKEQNLLLNQEQKKKESAQKIVKDVSDIVKNEGLALKEQDLEKLKDIVKETKEI